MININLKIVCLRILFFYILVVIFNSKLEDKSKLFLFFYVVGEFRGFRIYCVLERFFFVLSK